MPRPWILDIVGLRCPIFRSLSHLRPPKLPILVKSMPTAFGLSAQAIVELKGELLENAYLIEPLFGLCKV